jgi:RIO-like serine/threonine protein kinase
MVSTGHANAAELLERDINCLIKFFAMKMKYVPPDEALFKLEDLVQSDIRIDEEIRASGFEDEDGNALMNFDLSSMGQNAEQDEDSEEDDEEQELGENGAAQEPEEEQLKAEKKKKSKGKSVPDDQEVEKVEEVDGAVQESGQKPAAVESENSGDEDEDSEDDEEAGEGEVKQTVFTDKVNAAKERLRK